MLHGAWGRAMLESYHELQNRIARAGTRSIDIAGIHPDFDALEFRVLRLPQWPGAIRPYTPLRRSRLTGRYSAAHPEEHYATDPAYVPGVRLEDHAMDRTAKKALLERMLAEMERLGGPLVESLYAENVRIVENGGPDRTLRCVITDLASSLETFVRQNACFVEEILEELADSYRPNYRDRLMAEYRQAVLDMLILCHRVSPSLTRFFLDTFLGKKTGARLPR